MPVGQPQASYNCINHLCYPTIFLLVFHKVDHLQPFLASPSLLVVHLECHRRFSFLCLSSLLCNVFLLFVQQYCCRLSFQHNFNNNYRNTFCGMWYQVHSQVHNDRTVPIKISSTQPLNKGYTFTFFIVHARYGHISIFGLKYDITIMFLDPNFL